MSKDKYYTLLIDGENLLKQAFHGSDSYWNEIHIGGIVMFLTKIKQLINEYHPKRVIICWDGAKSGKLRYDIYKPYKANRDKDFYNDIEYSDKQLKREEYLNKSLLIQRVRVQQYCEELFFRQVIVEYIEADDLIGYYCTNLLDDNEEVIIYSNDRDFCQLLNDKVSLYVANKKVLVTPKNFYLFFDFHPENSLLIKTIEGDSSDNIYGVDGVKLKTLLKYFPEIKERKVNLNELINKAKEFQSDKKMGKHKSLQSIIEGRNFGSLRGMELYEINQKLVNLKEPFINEEAIELLKDCKYLPLDDSDRGSKNLMKLMMEDGFLNVIPGGSERYLDFIQPFLSVIKYEKDFLKSYNKS